MIDAHVILPQGDRASIRGMLFNNYPTGRQSHVKDISLIDNVFVFMLLSTQSAWLEIKGDIIDKRSSFKAKTEIEILQISSKTYKGDSEKIESRGD